MKSQGILIAYQDDQWVNAFSTSLHDTGYRVETAKTVSDLIRRVRSGEIQVVLLDEEVEGIKACDLVPLLKGIDGKIQVIVISSEESLGPVRRLRGTGIFYQAMKPVDPEELRSVVDCAFSKLEREHPLREGSLPFLEAEDMTA